MARPVPRRAPRHTPTDTKSYNARVSLARALSKLGVASRAEARRWILADRVTVNGRRVTDPERRVDPDRDRLAVDDGMIAPAQPLYVLMHKPRGVVTTRSDEAGRRTVYDVLAKADPAAVSEWIFPVGRLDRDSSGVLLMTNDTRWGNRLASPDSHVPKTYHVRVRPPILAQDLDRLTAGAVLAAGPTRPLAAVVVRQSPRGSWIEVTLTEGKNRQIRRLCARLGYRVETLVRIRVGDVALGTLQPGEVRRLTPDEVRGLAGGAITSRSRPAGGTSGSPQRRRWSSARRAFLGRK